MKSWMNNKCRAANLNNQTKYLIADTTLILEN